MSPPRWLRAILPAGLAVACVAGPSPSSFGPARSPSGTTCRADRGREPTVRGELLAIQDSSALLVVRNGAEDRIVAVPFRGTRSLGCQNSGLVQFTREGAVRDMAALSAIRRVSRFPYRLAPEVMSDLLAAYGQTQPDPPPARPR